jgi:hypothetical protein
VVHAPAFKSLRLRQYLLDKPFELHGHTEKLGQREPQAAVATAAEALEPPPAWHQERWLNLLVEFQNRVVHTGAGRTPLTSSPRLEALPRWRRPHAAHRLVCGYPG